MAQHQKTLDDSFSIFRSAKQLAVFLSKVNSGPSCFEWIGTIDKCGYGQTKLNGKTLIAHRVSFINFNGPTFGKLISHSCHNRKCVNPDHLKLADHDENMLDLVNKNNIIGVIVAGRPCRKCGSKERLASKGSCASCHRNYNKLRKRKIRLSE